MPTNPPSVPSLDVEACVRLLTDIADETPLLCICERGCCQCDERRATLRALASALPGMGKLSTRYEPQPTDATRAVETWHSMLPGGEDRAMLAVLDEYERKRRRALSAARAAQPEETP